MVILIIYALTMLMVTQKTSVNSFECTEFYTLFEERSCDDSNTINLKPALINPSTLNISKYKMPYDDHCADCLPQDDCFLQLSCDVIATECERLPTSTVSTQETTFYEPEQTTTASTTVDFTVTTKYTESTESETDTIVMETTEFITVTYPAEWPSEEDREFYTLFEETNCGDAKSVTILPAPINFKTWNISKLNSDVSCNGVYPPEDNFLEMSCEEIVTSCSKMGATDTLKRIATDLSGAVYALITIGALASGGLVSYAGYHLANKIIDIMQSQTYRLPQ